MEQKKEIRRKGQEEIKRKRHSGRKRQEEMERKEG